MGSAEGAAVGDTVGGKDVNTETLTTVGVT